MVVPVLDAAGTLGACLSAARAALAAAGHARAELLVADDGSRDDSCAIAASLGARVLPRPEGAPAGPGAARNRGLRAADAALVWCLDADTEADPDALAPLLRALEEPAVVAAGGAYRNAAPQRWLPRLIDAELACRHAGRGPRVAYLASFHVVYRRDAVLAVGGFDPTLRTAEDVELGWRLVAGGAELRFCEQARVAHHHPRRLWRYLRTQARHAHYRLRVYRRHPGRAVGDEHSGLIEASAPLVALAAAPLALVAALWPSPLTAPQRWGLALVAPALLLLGSLPMAARIARSGRGLDLALGYLPVAGLRAVAHACGLLSGLVSLGLAPPAPPAAEPA